MHKARMPRKSKLRFIKKFVKFRPHTMRKKYINAKGIKPYAHVHNYAMYIKNVVILSFREKMLT